MVENIKCVTVGDGGVGKTCMLIRYSTDAFFTEEHTPTIYDKHETDKVVDGRRVRLHLWDTAGQEGFNRLRPGCYNNTDVFIVCYSIVSPTSLENVREKWVKEIRFHCPEVPFVLVGTKTDLRTDPVEVESMTAAGKECTFVEASEGLEAGADLDAYGVLECSAKTKVGLGHVFDTAMRCVLASRYGNGDGNGNGSRCCCVIL